MCPLFFFIELVSTLNKLKMCNLRILHCNHLLTLLNLLRKTEYCVHQKVDDLIQHFELKKKNMKKINFNVKDVKSFLSKKSLKQITKCNI